MSTVSFRHSVRVNAMSLRKELVREVSPAQLETMLFQVAVRKEGCWEFKLAPDLTFAARFPVSQCVAVCCSVLQCVAVCCSVLQCGCSVVGVCLQCAAVCGRVLQSVAECCRVLQCVAVCCSMLQLLQCVAVCCRAVHCAALCCSVLQCVAVCCSAVSSDCSYCCRKLQLATDLSFAARF